MAGTIWSSLDAIDACGRKLVKQIDVASATVEDTYNKPYVRLISKSNKRGVISARVELDIADVHFPEKRIVLVMDNLDPHKLSTLYEIFAPAEASRLARRFKVHHTPRHGS